MTCLHAKCALCLRTTCNGTGPLHKIGDHEVCKSCVQKAVSWAMDTAMRWGGAYGTEKCGRES